MEGKREEKKERNKENKKWPSKFLTNQNTCAPYLM